ncbi:diaminopimelate epimerase [Halorussus marinus]|uniref:diaminopimelate epimerase n=1 Tax=Halorussus marinus TaxID=2505976 RepID=UPI0010931AEC|nr:diaminopimelate epimerase [Halorussus marinus]
MSIAYQKYHGTGNDFVIVDADEYVPDRAAFARAVCDPASTEGVGADGVLFLALEPQFSPPRAVMTLVQPDGSTAAMCGNGARCAAKWAAERTGADRIMLDTQAGTRRAEISDGAVTIEMGEPTFDPAAVPAARDDPLVAEEIEGLELTAVNTGVPHAVAFVDDVDAVDLDAVAPAVRHADVFPEGANVNLAAPRPDGGFDQRTFERGVEGETRSCGTGAVAIAVAARRLGRTTDPSVAVHPPGGRLDVTFRDGRATLTGPTEREFDGEVTTTPEPRRVGEA